jgi:hypothetical protein
MRFLFLAALLALAACEKLPESEAAKRIGQQPKKTMDGVANRVNSVMQGSGQDSERLKEGDEAK